jgi:uncharacterized protein YndB with AHSA1/START domain
MRTVGNQRHVEAPAGSQTISFTREFEAPVEAVFAAHTEPAAVARWIGPRGTTLTMREFDARTGGRWSYVVSAANGESWAFFGCFHEVTPSRRIVQTFEFEGDAEHPSMEVLTFIDLGNGRSRIDGRSVFLSVEERDAMLKDMDAGRDEDFDRLDEYLAG